MLVHILMFIFSLIILYIGFYLYSHRTKDFMLFKPTTNSVLSTTLSLFGKVIMIIGIITLILGFFDNSVTILAALVLGIFSTTGTLLLLLKFL
jgi:hypothetical protein